MVWMTIRRFTNALEKKLNWNLGCSLLLVGVLASAFLFYLWAQNLGKYTLQPGQSISLKVKPRTQDVEYYSELILKKNDKNKLELNGREYWSVSGSELHYDLSNQNVFKWVRDESGELTESYVENSDSADIYIEKSNLIIQYQGEKVFDVTNNKPYTITITNVDDKTAHFEAQVVDK